MRKLTVFETISLDGYFTDRSGDMSWAHKSDPEWVEFSSSNAQSGDGALLFGRKTYEMMAGFWPTEMARQRMPKVAEGMNRLPKFVASRTLDPARLPWGNTTVLSGDLAGEVRKLKAGSGSPIVILGSGSVIAELSKHRLIDQYTLVIAPVVLGGGRTPFDGVDRFEFRRTSARTFENGNVVMIYEPR